MFYGRQHLRSAETICRSYDGSLPLAAFLKQYFQQHKKFGSKDRKQIAHIAYCYYRLGHSLKHLSFEERALVALFLCQDAPGNWEALFPEEWVAAWGKQLSERIHFVQQHHPDFSALSVFPCLAEVGVDYEPEAFAFAHLVQPNLFLRLRPGYESHVKNTLREAGIDFSEEATDCISLANNTSIDKLLTIDKHCVVQDLSSQRVGDLFAHLEKRTSLSVWDCCAASGGKSLLVWDKAGMPVRLTASDVRESIIHNLQQRFRVAGVLADDVFVADITQSLPPNKQYDLVICDAPCSGSGTWGRTPEQLYFFQQEKIETYASLQHRILMNVSNSVRKGGYLIYITCSVFSKENEQQLPSLINKGFRQVEIAWLKGHPQKADSMFACLMQKNDS